jgi:hypothetical protein
MKKFLFQFPVEFIAEFITRLFSKKPKFFLIVQIHAVVIGGLSKIFQELVDSGIDLPPVLDNVSDVSVQLVSLAAAIIAQLPKQDVNSK